MVKETIQYKKKIVLKNFLDSFFQKTLSHKKVFGNEECTFITLLLLKTLKIKLNR